MERIKKKFGCVMICDLSDKEKVWVEEVKGFENSIFGFEVDILFIDFKIRQFWKWFEEIKEFSDLFLVQVEWL